MESEQLKTLEKKYWLGETSRVEESILRKATKDKNAQESLSPELIGLFADLASASDIELGADFDTDFWKRAIPSAESASFNPTFFMRYAAIGLILISAAFSFWNVIHNSPTPYHAVAEMDADTYSSPEKAFEETKRALMFASLKLNRGAQTVGEIKRFYNTKESISELPDSDLKNTKQ